MNSSIKCPSFKMFLSQFCFIVLSIVIYIPAIAQEQPPKPIEVSLTSITVNTAQYLNFGTFILAGTTGTVTVDYSGARTATWSALLPAVMSSTVSSARFIVTALPGTLITIQGTNNTLICPGGSVELTMYGSDPSSPFIVPPANPGNKYTEVQVRIGGTLTISSATIPGIYGGPFTVNFIQQ